MFKNWFKVFWFHTLRHKIYFILTVLSLAIGISGVLLSTSFYLEEVTYDKWNPNKDNVFVVESQLDGENSWMKLPYPFGEKLKELSPDVKDYMYMDGNYNGGVIVYEGKKNVFQRSLRVQSSFFEFFPLKLLKGTSERAFSKPNSVIIKDTYAASLFGDKEPMGETLRINDFDYVVSGIYTLGDARSSVNAELIINSLDDRIKEEFDSWGTYNSACWLKLNDPKKKEVVEAMIYHVLEEYNYKPAAKEEGVEIDEFVEKVLGGGQKFVLHDLAGQRMTQNGNLNGTPEGATSMSRMYILIGLSFLILVLSVFNYINLTMAKSIARGKEVGIRKTLGAGRMNLMAQGLFEAFFTVCIALVVALVIIEFTLPWLRVFLDTKLSFTFFNSWLLLLVVVLIVVLLVGIIPSFFMAGFKTLEMLKGGVIRSKRGIVFKNTLLVIQFAVACFFMIGTYIVYQQVSYMLSKDLGFSGAQVAVVQFLPKGNRDDKAQVYENIKEDLLRVKGVEGVSTASLDIASPNGASSSFIHNGNRVQAMIAAMDYNFLDLYNIKVQDGRRLSASLASDSISNVLLNEKAVRLMQESNPVGKVIDWNGVKFNVVGIVKDFNLYNLQADYPPIIFFSLKTVPWASSNIMSVSIKIDGATAERTMKEIEDIWTKREMSYFPFQYEFADKRFAKTFSRSIQERNIFLTLSLVVIFIALFGLYSLASFSMNSRLKEVSIRKVLGANSSELLKELSVQYVWYCLIGFGLALFPSYYFIESWLNNYAFRIEIEWVVYVICLATILILTLIVVLSRALLATKVDVLKYLKYE